MSAPVATSTKTIEKFLAEKEPWISKKTEYFKSIGPGIHIDKKEVEKYKKETHILVTQRLEFFNEVYKFTYNKITVKNQKTRWGSCSRRKNLNFNVKIALLPKHLADYIVVHELCHVGELNHSKKFWDLVQRTMPEYKKLKKELVLYSH